MTQTYAPILMHSRELAQLLGCSPALLSLWRKSGQGPNWYRLEGRPVYDRADVLEWLDEQSRHKSNHNSKKATE